MAVRRATEAPAIAPQLTHVAIDCGSYTLAQHQLQPGFHFTAEQYVTWIRALGPAVKWAVLPDWPCENVGASEVRRRQVSTTNTAIDLLSEYLDAGWCWCPVLQGQRVDDYLRHAINIAAWVYELRDVYAGHGQADAFRVCVGSLCRRNSLAEIRSILRHVAQVLPRLPLHLFGVKLDVIEQTGYLPEAVVSIDSAAWTGRFAHQINVSADEQRRTCASCRVVEPARWSGAPARCSRCGGGTESAAAQSGLQPIHVLYRACDLLLAVLVRVARDTAVAHWAA